MTLVIDALTHISTGPDDVIGWGPHFTAEELIQQMDAPRKIMGESMRVDKAIVFPSMALTVPTSTLSFKDQHAYVLDSVEKHPDRLIGGVAVHARLWNDEVAKQFEDMVKNHNFRMIYIHPSLHKYWLPINTPSEGEGSKQMLYPLFEAARDLNVPVLIHTGEQPYSMPATVEFVAGEFSDVNMIIGHLGTQGEMLTGEALLVAERHANVYLETSFAMGHMLIEAAHSIGPERLLFGSNTPPQEPTQQLMMVTESLTLDPPVGMGLSIEKTRKVLGENLAQLLGITQ
jgi:predicted TIM-barrel fold metal-dependent hydrolase